MVNGLNLHATSDGTSTALLLRAIFCNPWGKVVIYSSNSSNVGETKIRIDRLAEQTNTIIPDLEVVEIPSLDKSTNMVEMFQEFSALNDLPPLEMERDILFYSGTTLHVRGLATIRGFSSIMVYDRDVGFKTVGHLQHEFGDLAFDKVTFFSIYDAAENSSEEGEDSWQEIHFRNGEYTRSKKLRTIRYHNGIIEFEWDKAATATQRKKIAKDCLMLEEIFGVYSVRHLGLDSQILRLRRFPALLDEENLWELEGK